MTKTQKYTKWVALSMVMANMIGTGVFTSLGFQVGPLPSGFVILMLWLLGGLVALAGAFCYAEIATRIKRSGGEYSYLSEIFHPGLGFASGWISIFAGFAAPICAVSMAIGSYFAPVVGFTSDSEIFAVSAFSIIAISALQLLGVKKGGGIQNVLTSIKLLFILFFCIAPFLITTYEPSGISFAPQSGDSDLFFSSSFAISLVYVYLAYSGWNASAYIAGNLENPKKSLPFSLILGTGIVMTLYLIINAVFLYVSDFGELHMKVDVGNVVALKIFGAEYGKVFSGLFSLALISSLSAMVIAGPKVTESMGEDHKVFSVMTKKNRGGAPYPAIIFQALIALMLLYTSTFEDVMKYIGIALSLFSTLTVAGLFVLRSRSNGTEDVVKTIGYPITPIFFIAVNLYMIYLVLSDDWQNGNAKVLTISIVTIVSGYLAYYLSKEIGKRIKS
jgi:APA family basic amino acid/polyamine antiporter